eukprot:gene43247-52861_t
MVTELAAGRALPPHSLSAEALQRIAERERGAQQRGPALKKKAAAPVVPARQGLPPAPNSVAAKRLAAKRGEVQGPATGSLGSGNLGSGNLGSGNLGSGNLGGWGAAEEEEDLFAQHKEGDFPGAGAGTSSGASASASNNNSSNFNINMSISTFDPFADDAPAAPAAPPRRPSASTQPTSSSGHSHGPSNSHSTSNSAAAVLFGALDEHEPSGDAQRRGAAAAQQAHVSQGFDAFADDEDEQQQEDGEGAFDPFAAPPALAFDPFAADASASASGGKVESILDFGEP